VNSIPIDRRSLLASVAALGGTLALGFELGGPRLAHAQAAGTQAAGTEVNAWILIAPDDSVTIRVARAEMGQGVLTALPMLVAEELECDWSKVRTELVAPQDNMRHQRAWGDMSTGGSRSVRSSQQALRKAGAAAREMLVAAAAARWAVAASECRARNSVVTHLPSGRTVSFGEIAAAAAQSRVPVEVKLKEPGEWRLLGTPQRRLDVPGKVSGETTYGIDVRLPGMLYAAVLQAPAFGAKLKSVDDSRTRGMSGIRKLVTLDDAVAIIAEDWWRARKALEALEVSWDLGNNAGVSTADIAAYLRRGLAAEEAAAGRSDGDFAAAFAATDRRIEADYAVPFLAHATLEPQNTTAHVRGDEVEVWTPTQNGEAALVTAAQAAGVPRTNVIVHRTMLGGGFGRRDLIQDFIGLAVRIAGHVPQPVKVVWTREEDMRHDFYRPMAMARMRAGIGAAGEPIAWHVRLTGPSLLPMLLPGHVDKQFQEGFVEDMPYDVANYLADYAMRPTPVPVGFWRCVNHTQNCFFRECFLDELAHAAGADPYQYRRKLLGGHPRAGRLRAALDAVADRAEWGKPSPEGSYRGIALNEVQGTCTAAVIEAAVAEGVRVKRVISAIDCGLVVNPRTIEAQVQSATVFALSAALYGEITIRNGGVEQSNFQDYGMLRLADMPVVETVIMASGEPWSGVGEPPVAVVAPALCNAIFAATGHRIRSLPIKNHQLKNG
jgi:isoquinoline 1-oxidoreductase beta subunit